MDVLAHDASDRRGLRILERKPQRGFARDPPGGKHPEQLGLSAGDRDVDISDAEVPRAPSHAKATDLNLVSSRLRRSVALIVSRRGRRLQGSPLGDAQAHYWSILGECHEHLDLELVELSARSLEDDNLADAVRYDQLAGDREAGGILHRA